MLRRLGQEVGGGKKTDGDRREDKFIDRVGGAGAYTLWENEGGVREENRCEAGKRAERNVFKGHKRQAQL